ncbi:MAG TPA: ABC transporter ATP-binding protein [Candidatus Polarisedimenticolaceae bacterium]|nr:ABC transporter ATP-binding protein [Candidatus Polarisedimenticolaceae bacterium]
MSDGLVQVEGLRKSFAGVTAVDGISFEVARGEMFGLIGPDGAGKTTTLRILLGLLGADAGRVTTCGLDPLGERRALSRRIGYLPQRFSLYGDLSVGENIAFFARVHGVPGWRPRRDELLELLRMSPFRERLAERLSGGMKQKLALACTLIHTPELLVLDEPTTGVDPVSRRDFWRILSRLLRSGLTILLTTPYLDEADRCGRVALMDRGRILIADAPERLRDGWSGAMLEVLASPKGRAREILEADHDVSGIQVFGERLHVGLAGTKKADARAAAERIAGRLRAKGVDVQSSRAIEPALEDVFIARVLESGR